MWWKLTGLGVLAATLIVLMIAPTVSVDVQVDMPAHGAPRMSGDTFAFDLTVFTGVFLTAMLALIAWLAYRVVRNGRRSN